MVFHFDASTEAFVAELTAASYGFNGPCSVAADGTHVWVGNCHGDSVTELDAAAGAPVQVLDAPRYKICRRAAGARRPGTGRNRFR
jgi:hypothetical protein